MKFQMFVIENYASEGIKQNLFESHNNS